MKWLARTPKNKPRERDSILDKIGKIRGIQDVNRFLHPSVDELFDPYLIKNIEDASNRIIRAIASNERIVVSYDPDADGLTSATIMIRYLKNYTENVDFIYGERNDGHGITEMVKLKVTDEERLKRSKANIEKIKQADLLILIDSSSNDVEVCKNISENVGCDIVILDHHAIERENPYVLMVNPQQDGDEYPNKYLSGAGVVFKTLQVMEDTLGQVDVWQYIDLVAVGMYADVMRIDVLENRYLIMQGLRNMKNVGLVRILKGAKVDTFRMTSTDIGFSIAPLLNGVARMDNIKLAIDILLTDDDNEAKPLRLKMQKINEARKELQKKIVANYMEKVNPNEKILVVLDEQSSKGFNGIVAQNLAERYKRPVIVGRLHKGTASGSFRSYGGLDLKGLLMESGFVEEAMGHKQAGGFTVKEENLENLLKFIEENMPDLEEKEPTVVYDLEIDVSEIHEYIGAIEQFNKLVGNGFPKITVKVSGITVEMAECIGKTRETVKIKTFDDMELIKFRVNEDYASELSYFDTISVVGELRVNRWYNFKTKELTEIPQVMIEDYAV
jgi:single-stranded-DNA-specific exonuclease